MTDSQRKHDWAQQTDADGDPYKSCRRSGCFEIWSHMHNSNSPEPVGCTGQDNKSDKK